MINVQTATPFEAITYGFATGLVGTLGVRILDNEGGTVLARTTAGITEQVPDSGVYAVTLTSPVPLGQYSIVWDDGSGDEAGFSQEDLNVYADIVPPELPPMAPLDAIFAPLAPLDEDGGPVPGPCQAWTTDEDVAACCNAVVGSDVTVYGPYASEASRVFYELSARQFSGACTQVVRPCARRRCGFQVLQGGYVVNDPFYANWWWNGRAWWNDSTNGCSCSPLSRVLLPGYPVRDILEVIIDGQVLDPTFAGGSPTYRLDRRKYLTRMADPDNPNDILYWPSCQRMDLPSTAAGTWEVVYRTGADPPPLGQMAAAELACQLYLGCSNNEGVREECLLPTGVVRIERQGVTMELQSFRQWAFDKKNGRWNTGLPYTDTFLNTYNPQGLRRRPAVWGPDALQYAERVGTQAGS